MESSYNKAMSRGNVKAASTVCLITGAAGSGKTHVKCFICKIPPPEERNSTSLGERPMRVYSMDFSDEQGQWGNFDETKELKSLAQAMDAAAKNSLENSHSTTAEDSLEKSPSKTNLTAEEKIPETVITPTTVPSQLPSSTEPALSSRAMHDGSSSASHERRRAHERQRAHERDKLKKKIIGLLETTNVSKEFHCDKRLYIIDSGGQSSFHELLSLFFHNIDVTIFVIDLSQQLDECPFDDWYEHNKPNAYPVECSLTQEQVIKRTFRAFETQKQTTERTKRNHQLVIVGTHRDDPKVNSKNLKDKNERLQSLLCESLHSHLIQRDCAVIYDVNALNPESCDKTCIIRKELREKFQTLVNKHSESIPVRWYVLEQFLRMRATNSYMSSTKKTFKNILSFNQCWEEAKALKMEREELSTVLEYFTDLNVLFYYKDCLPDVVFCNAEPLIKILSELVKLAIELRNPEKTKDEKGRNFVNGTVTKEFLDECYEASLKSDIDVDSQSDEDTSGSRTASSPELPIFTSVEFLKLLCIKHIAVALSGGDHFIPCVLKEQKRSELDELMQQIMPSKCTPIPPLAVYFPHEDDKVSPVPAGVFCCLVTSLLSKKQKPYWELKKKEQANQYAYVSRQCIMFEVKSGRSESGTITLIDAYTHFEVHIDDEECDSTSVASFCQKVKDDVLKHSKLVCKDRSIQPRCGIVCTKQCDVKSRYTETSHLAEVEEKDSQYKMYCTKKCIKKSWTLPGSVECVQYWFPG